jgi:hypothetical protein
MESSSRLYDTIVSLLGQHEKWLDVRHLKTVAVMIVGLIQSETINLTQWIGYVKTRARFAQSTQRRFARWLNNGRISVHCLYGPLIQKALDSWGEHTIYLALDTTMLWGQLCVVRCCVVYRGRAVPIVWQVLAHSSPMIAFSVYKGLLERVPPLLPEGVKVALLADRGFADTDLIDLAGRLGWQYRIRIKKSFLVYRKGRPPQKVGRFSLGCGAAIFLHNVRLTATQVGPVHLALGCSTHHQLWYVVSSEPTNEDTFNEYGLRFDIEENFLDDKSNGFQLESSMIRSAAALCRLCFVLAVTTLYLVSCGTQVVASGKRRWVDPHWKRGSSYLRIGWRWVKTALVRGWSLWGTLHLNGEPDPEPAIACRKQAVEKANRLKSFNDYRVLT